MNASEMVLQERGENGKLGGQMSEYEQKEDKKLRRPSKAAYVGRWEEAPQHTQDNEYIRGGYRINCDSMQKIVRSLFTLHNESLNVWTHLCGAIFFVCLITYVAVWISPRIVFPTIEVIKTEVGKYLGQADGQYTPGQQYCLRISVASSCNLKM
jgi:hypothetical protein